MRFLCLLQLIVVAVSQRYRYPSGYFYDVGINSEVSPLEGRHDVSHRQRRHDTANQPQTPLNGSPVKLKLVNTGLLGNGSSCSYGLISSLTNRPVCNNMERSNLNQLNEGPLNVTLTQTINHKLTRYKKDSNGILKYIQQKASYSSPRNVSLVNNGGHNGVIPVLPAAVVAERATADDVSNSESAEMTLAEETSEATGVTECPADCPTSWIGDGWCDKTCFVAECNYDDNDCDDWCAPGCPEDWMGNGVCEGDCNKEECKYDLGDCP